LRHSVAYLAPSPRGVSQTRKHADVSPVDSGLLSVSRFVAKIYRPIIGDVDHSLDIGYVRM